MLSYQYSFDGHVTLNYVDFERLGINKKYFFFYKIDLVIVLKLNKQD